MSNLYNKGRKYSFRSVAVSWSVMGTYETVKSAADYIKSRISKLPEIGIICGSGLGTLAEVVTDTTVIRYSEIKEFPKSTVAGHAGNLVFGKLSGKNVVVMQGRFHPYEGYEMSQVSYMISY